MVQHERPDMTTAHDIAKIVSDHLGIAMIAASNDTRLDDLIADEVLVIELISEIEKKCGADIPDLEITTTATFGQLAALVDQYKVKAA